VILAAAGQHRDLSISVALPVYNEMHTLRAVVDEAVGVLNECAVRDWEIVMVDDGSTDDSRSVMAEISEAYPNARVVRHETRRGFAAVQGSCYQNSRLDWIFLLPADGQIPPPVLRDLMRYCHDFDIICGVTTQSPEHLARRLSSGIYHWIVDALFALNVGNFGPCLLLRRDTIKGISVRAGTPVAMTELLVRARKAGARIVGVEMEKRPRPFGKGKGGAATSSLQVLRDLGALWVQTRHGA
jgi:glycosyltransferase involved in cell wall biosynthesis